MVSFLTGNNKPVSHAEEIHTHKHIDQGVFYFMSSFCAVGIILAVGFLVFNIRYSDIRYGENEEGNLRESYLFSFIDKMPIWAPLHYHIF